MQDYRVQQAQVYTDFRGLNALKSQARTDKQAALEQEAQQFESLFLSERLKSMRKAGEVFAEGNYLNSKDREFYRDMLDSQISLRMAKGTATGLAEALVRQLGESLTSMASEGEERAALKATLADDNRSKLGVVPRIPDQ